ncbi:hypothetical protein [Mesorhizobium sp. M0029]|uniref:hypothetical protein n=1 Tax=Mesorhizobium sp. M0029 TaxID=2956850 RepID=UPI003339DAF5
MGSVDFSHRALSDTINAQNSMAAISGEGSPVSVLMRRLNSSCRRSMAVAVLALSIGSASVW